MIIVKGAPANPVEIVIEGNTFGSIYNLFVEVFLKPG